MVLSYFGHSTRDACLSCSIDHVVGQASLPDRQGSLMDLVGSLDDQRRSSYFM